MTVGGIGGLDSRLAAVRDGDQDLAGEQRKVQHNVDSEIALSFVGSDAVQDTGRSRPSEAGEVETVLCFVRIRDLIQRP